MQINFPGESNIVPEKGFSFRVMPLGVSTWPVEQYTGDVGRRSIRRHLPM